jgi:hypothetical protein
VVIYKATNKVNGKIYVGKTVEELARRRKRHLWTARSGSECVFPRAIRKYGIDGFEFEVLCRCSSEEELDQKEVEMIRLLNSKKPIGYNMTDGGEGTSGREVSEEVREKMRACMTGRKHTREARARISAGHIGIKHTEETKAKHRAAMIGNKINLGRKATDETKAKLSAAKMGHKINVGRKQTAEWIEKRRKANIGNKYRAGHKWSEEHKAKLREACTGWKQTDEARAKIKAAWVIRKQKIAA